MKQCSWFAANSRWKSKPRPNRENLLAQAIPPRRPNEFSSLPAASRKNPWTAFAFCRDLRPSVGCVEDRNVTSTREFQFLRKMLFEIQAVGTRRLEPRRGHEIRYQHAINEISEVVGFDCIANFERIDFAVAAECAPVDPWVCQHFK